MLDHSQAAIDFQAIFEAAPGANLVLSPAFRILGASNDYLRATMTERGDIVNRHLFEAFPDNPDDPTADGVRNLQESLSRVLAKKQSDVMAIQKYDIRRGALQGAAFEERYWSPANTPLMDARGEVQYIIHHVEDVTALHRTQHRLRTATQDSQHNERLAVLGGILSSIAFDLLDPMSVIQTSSYLMSKHSNDADYIGRHIARIGDQLRVANRMLSTMVGIACERIPAWKEVSIAALLASIVEERHSMLGTSLAIAGVAELPPVLGNAPELRQALISLIQMTRRATHPARKVQVRGQLEGQFIELVIVLAAQSNAECAAPTEPTAADSTSNESAALDLPTVEHIVQKHGGTLYWTDCENATARFELRLPVSTRA